MNVKDIILWIGTALVTALAFFGTYHYDFSGPIEALIWIGWFVLTALLAFFTTQGRQAFEFAKEAKIELQKVVWPTRQETVQTTSIVMIMVTVTGFVLWGIDSGMMWIIAKITRLG
ncbi:Preprotein translocase subunit SecE [Legionella massiliensis]|uniref:Protein translocase subunit SecE n=2 Tax=Legionella massiliensis TaxID=1034943 RepID=A0A078KYT9_9GAMM|nr:Preprotein translocase subunit SecE [Legionella massiliensis]CEE13844.1 Protein translocase subunit SecE [Legionella massiliensis]